MQAFERFALDGLQGAPALDRLLAGLASALGEEAVRIMLTEATDAISGSAGNPRAGAVRPRIGADLPGRAMTGHSVLLELGDLGVAHTVEIVVGGVVLADVIDTETEIFAVAPAALRSTVGCGATAAFPLAGRVPLLRLVDLALGAYADRIKIF